MNSNVARLQHRSVTIFIVALAALVFGLILIARSCSVDLAGHYNQRVSSQKGTLFIKGLATGITRDHQVWWITTNEVSVEPDSETDFIWKDLQPFFFRLDGDTLHLLVRQGEARRPQSFGSGLQVVQGTLSREQYAYLLAKGDSLGWKLAEM